MADNNSGMIMHKLTVKANRLESGMLKFINAKTDEEKVYAYHYALGCLGGDHVKKNLMKTRYCGKVITELKENKFVTAERADALISEWSSSYVEPPQEEESVKPHLEQACHDDCGNACVTDTNATRGVQQSELNEVAFRYYNKTRTTDPSFMPKEYRLVHDEALSSWMVYHTFPDEVTAYGKKWKKQKPTKVDDQVYDVAYAVEQANMGF